jgi:ankyrin repeat protein
MARSFVLLLVPLAVLAQNSKQELNDQLWEATRKGDVVAVTALLDKGADVNAKFRYGTTALFKAAERGHVEVVKILLDRGADVSVKDTFYGATAMTWALSNKHIEVVGALLEKEPARAGEVLMTGAREGNTELVRLALDKGGLNNGPHEPTRNVIRVVSCGCGSLCFV